MAPLDRAVALEQVDAVALRIGEDLDLHVAQALYELLEQDAVVAERCCRLALGAGDLSVERVGARRDLHALAAAAGRGLDQHRPADAPGLLAQHLRVLVGAVITGHHGHARRGHQRLGFRFAPHRAYRVGGRTDEDDAGFGASLGEGGVFGQEAVTRVDRLGARASGRLEDGVDPQIALARRRQADTVGLVGHLDVQRARVGIGVDGDGAHAQPPGSTNDAAGDLAAVGDEDLGEHRAHRFQAGLRFSRKAPTPSRPSTPARWRAMRSAVSCTTASSVGRRTTARISSFAAD